MFSSFDNRPDSERKLVPFASKYSLTYSRFVSWSSVTWPITPENTFCLLAITHDITSIVATPQPVLWHEPSQIVAGRNPVADQRFVG